MQPAVASDIEGSAPPFATAFAPAGEVSTDIALPRAARWRAALAVYREAPVLRMVLLGFSSGLPYLLVFGTLSFWLRDAGIDRTTIGFVSWVALAYAFKWAWAPLVDRLPLPGLTARLGRRRAWLLASQCLLAFAIVAMACTDPVAHLRVLVALALLTAFASATQDIALDAYRIESAAVAKQAALAAAYQVGYRVAMVWSGAGVLAIAAGAEELHGGYDYGSWSVAYLAMAASMLVGIVATLRAPEPALPNLDALFGTTADDACPRTQRDVSPAPSVRWLRVSTWIRNPFVGPFVEFFVRYRAQALLILALIATYRMSDVVMGVMANPFYKDMGFSKDEVAMVSKLFGVVMTLVGAAAGGVLSLRFGVARTLLVGAVLSAATNLLFAMMAGLPKSVPLLAAVITADNIAAGIASSSFIAYLSGLTNVAYSATQYALFSSTMLLLPKILAGFSGLAVDTYGYPAFFVGTALLGVPVLILLLLNARATASKSLSATVATAARPPTVPSQ